MNVVIDTNVLISGIFGTGRLESFYHLFFTKI